MPRIKLNNFSLKFLQKNFILKLLILILQQLVCQGVILNMDTVTAPTSARKCLFLSFNILNLISQILKIILIVTIIVMYIELNILLNSMAACKVTTLLRHGTLLCLMVINP